MLKTDYKNRVIAEEREKYNLINNPDGTVSFDKVSTVIEAGDKFGGGDINETNEAVNSLELQVDNIGAFEILKTITLPKGYYSTNGRFTIGTFTNPKGYERFYIRVSGTVRQEGASGTSVFQPFKCSNSALRLMNMITTLNSYASFNKKQITGTTSFSSDYNSNEYFTIPITEGVTVFDTLSLTYEVDSYRKLRAGTDITFEILGKKVGG